MLPFTWQYAASTNDSGLLPRLMSIVAARVQGPLNSGRSTKLEPTVSPPVPAAGAAPPPAPPAPTLPLPPCAGVAPDPALGLVSGAPAAPGCTSGGSEPSPQPTAANIRPRRPAITPTFLFTREAN